MEQVAGTMEPDSQDSQNRDCSFVWDDNSQLYFHARFKPCSGSLLCPSMYVFSEVVVISFLNATVRALCRVGNLEAVVDFTMTQTPVGTIAVEMVFITNLRMAITCFFVLMR